MLVMPAAGLGAKPVCHLLVGNQATLTDITNCEWQLGFGFQTGNGVFDLTGLDQATADKVLYEQKTTSGTSGPDLDKPKLFLGDVILKNSEVERLTLAIQTISGVQQNVQITGNTKLTSLKIRTDDKKRPTLVLDVRGNKRLSMSSIKKLAKVVGVDTSNSKIQEHKECFFDSQAIKRLSDLEGCTGVNEDLVIDKNTITTTIPPSLRISKIRNGCLKLEGSSLTSLDFLKDLLEETTTPACSKGGSPSIKDNNQLCLTSEEQAEWAKAGYTLVYTDTCDDRCTVEFAVSNPTAPCQIVIGDVKITDPVNQTKLELWDRVTVLEGTLEVDNTDLKGIVIFKNLTKIDNPFPEKRALSVTRNSKMTKFDLPKLLSITSPNNTFLEPMLVVKNNASFEFSTTEALRWLNITGQSALPIPVEIPPPPPTAAPAPTPSTRSPDQIRDQNKKNQEENEKTESEGMIVVIIGVAGFLLILGCCVGVGLWVYSTKKKGLKEKREDHDALTTNGETKSLRQEIPKGGRAQEREELTKDLDAPAHKLDYEEKNIMAWSETSCEEREFANGCQMSLQAMEVPFKMSDMITDINAEELDFKNALEYHVKEKTIKKFYRFADKYKKIYYNPNHMKCKPTPYMEKYDADAVLKVLLTNCNEFFVTNHHLLPDVINDLSGPYYGGTSKTLLAKISGPYVCITDGHSSLDLFQVILSLDFSETKVEQYKKGKKAKLHPALRQKYVIMGDMIDRGPNGLECYVLCCLMAKKFPDRFVVLRGNHDQRMPKLELKKEEIDMGETINIYGEQLKAAGKVANPYHFADCMMWDLIEKVTAYMPYACLANGRVLVSHAGISVPMLRMKGTLDEIFEQIPVPFVEQVQLKHDGYNRYFNSFACETHFVVDKPDKYTERLEKLWEDLRFFELGDAEEGYAAYKKRRAEYSDSPINPYFEMKYPWMYAMLWSDPGGVLASAGNTRLAGSTYSMENLEALCKKHFLDYVVRGHKPKSIIYCNGRLVHIYSNPYHGRNSGCNVEPRDRLEPTRFDHYATILRVNEDGTRTFVLISITSEKGRDQELVELDTKIRRELGGYRKERREKRDEQWEKKCDKEENEKKEEEEKKGGDGAQTTTSQQKTETSKSRGTEKGQAKSRVEAKPGSVQQGKKGHPKKSSKK